MPKYNVLSGTLKLRTSRLLYEWAEWRTNVGRVDIMQSTRRLADPNIRSPAESVAPK